jgi:FKBP-type peptidyl-prolyl cis-trans isomerase
MNKINILLLSLAISLGMACNKKAAESGANTTTTPSTAETTTASGGASANIAPTNPSNHTPYVIEDSTKMIKLEGGLKLYMVKEGTGAKPSLAATVMINYQGRLKNGTIFDQSYPNPKAAEFPLTNLIKGWQVGLTSVKMGSSFVLIVPPEMGYGSQGQNNIPPNSTLIFDIDLLNFY